MKANGMVKRNQPQKRTTTSQLNRINEVQVYNPVIRSSSIVNTSQTTNLKKKGNGSQGKANQISPTTAGELNKGLDKTTTLAVPRRDSIRGNLENIEQLKLELKERKVTQQKDEELSSPEASTSMRETTLVEEKRTKILLKCNSPTTEVDMVDIGTDCYHIVEVETTSKAN
ncbi:hypothetical protein ACH5RR_008730 [Cinchona calisaya]|uniref:Uncharacterized protein n=1 Tax=Cinchona calisaya TaxID=153742 RepID=A0ABD3ACX5_9GENT